MEPVPVEDGPPPVIQPRHVDPDSSSESMAREEPGMEEIMSSGGEEDDSSSSASDVSAVAEELAGVVPRRILQRQHEVAATGEKAPYREGCASRRTTSTLVQRFSICTRPGACWRRL